MASSRGSQNDGDFSAGTAASSHHDIRMRSPRPRQAAQNGPQPTCVWMCTWMCMMYKYADMETSGLSLPLLQLQVQGSGLSFR
jgi:hypothetical protein